MLPAGNRVFDFIEPLLVIERFIAGIPEGLALPGNLLGVAAGAGLFIGPPRPCCLGGSAFALAVRPPLFVDLLHDLLFLVEASRSVTGLALHPVGNLELPVEA